MLIKSQPAVKKSLRQRRELLYESFQEVEGEFQYAQHGNTNVLDEIQTLLDDSVKASCEGLMVKMLDTDESGYEPSKRSRNWLKVFSIWKLLEKTSSLTVTGQEGLSQWRRGFFGSSCTWCILRTRKAYVCLWRVPSGSIQREHASLRDNMQHRYGFLRSHSRRVPQGALSAYH